MKNLIAISLAFACWWMALQAKASFNGTDFTADAPVTLFNASSTVTISNANFGDFAYSSAAILIISNISSTNIMVNWAAPGSAIGFETTNQLTLPGGKFAVYTINTFLNGLHMYQVHLTHDMPALADNGGSGTATNGGTGTGGGPGTGGGLGGDYITNGLMAYWKLNDGAGTSAADSSGNGFTVSLVGAPVWGTNYLTLDGSTQYGDAGPGAAEISWHDMSLSAWMKKTGSAAKSIVDKSFNIPGTGLGGWGLGVQGDGHLSFWGGQTIVDNGKQTVALGNWTFVTAVWHSVPQSADFYINGILSSTVQNSAVMNFATFGFAHLQLGDRQNNLLSGAFIFDGSLRDVGVYGRALSAVEIETNFLATEPNTNVVTPDLFYLKMHEGVLNETNATLNLADSSTSDNTNVVLFYPYPVIWKTNQAGISNALHFNGVSSYIDTHTNAFNFTTNLFTINIWLQPYAASARILANGFSHANGWFLDISGTYQVVFGAETPGAETAMVTDAGAANDGAWTMVTVVRADPTTVLIYINGRQVTTTGSFTSPASSSNSLIIGSNKEKTNWYDGNLSQPQIWSTALSSVDIANLYLNQVKGVPWP